MIAIFKKEKDNRLEDDHVKLNILQNYSLLWDILKLPSIQLLAIALLTAKVNIVLLPTNQGLINSTPINWKYSLELWFIFKYSFYIGSILNLITLYIYIYIFQISHNGIIIYVFDLLSSDEMIG